MFVNNYNIQFCIYRYFFSLCSLKICDSLIFIPFKTGMVNPWLMGWIWPAVTFCVAQVLSFTILLICYLIHSCNLFDVENIEVFYVFNIDKSMFLHNHYSTLNFGHFYLLTVAQQFL